MREAILVQHPAPVLHVPRRGKHERLSVARIETPAFLNALDPDAFEPMRDADGQELSTRMRGGRPWQPLRMGAGEARAAIPPDRFRAFLRGDLDQGEQAFQALVSTFRRGPLVAVATRHDWKGEAFYETDIGKRVDVDGSRSIAADGREACAQALRDFLEDDVAVVGDEVWIRMRPLARYQHDSTNHTLTLLSQPHAVPTSTWHLGLDRIEDGVAALRNEWDRAPERSKVLDRFLSALPPGYDHSDDLAYLANTLPADVRRGRIGTYFRTEDVERIEAAQERLRPAEFAAMTGQVTTAEAPDVLRAVHEGASAFLRANPHGNPQNWLLGRAKAHLERSVLPRFDASLTAEDEAALAL